jgi:hypothetical protein
MEVSRRLADGELFLRQIADVVFEVGPRSMPNSQAAAGSAER